MHYLSNPNAIRAAYPRVQTAVRLPESHALPGHATSQSSTAAAEV